MDRGSNNFHNIEDEVNSILDENIEIAETNDEGIVWMSAPLPNASQDESLASSHDQGLKRMKQAAERYRKAMASEKERDRLIEDYLPLVKSIVSRMRHHFPDTYETEDMYGIGAKALVVSVNQFNPSKGKSFGNYAALRIRGALLDELPAHDSNDFHDLGRRKDSIDFVVLPLVHLVLLVSREVAGVVIR